MHTFIHFHTGRNLIDEALDSPNGVFKCKKVLHFTADFKDESQVNEKRTRKRKLIKPSQGDADLLIELKHECKKLKVVQLANKIVTCYIQLY